MTATTLCVLAAHVAPALAAEPAPKGGPVDAQLFAKASNGYAATLKSEGDKLTLTLSRGFLSALVYRFHGRVSATGIEARIGNLGTIDLRFLPKGKTKRVLPPRNCSGGRSALTEGHYVGEFHFRAERGATAIDLSHARGAVATPGWRCHYESFASRLESVGTNATYTVLQAKDTDRAVGFNAIGAVIPEHPTPTGLELNAALETHRGPLTIDHLALALTTNAVTFDTALGSATVKPSKPFHGAASYCRTCAPGSQWTGDLSVTLPGVAAPVKLTGPAFETSLRSYGSGGAAEGPTG